MELGYTILSHSDFQNVRNMSVSLLHFYRVFALACSMRFCKKSLFISIAFNYWVSDSICVV